MMQLFNKKIFLLFLLFLTVNLSAFGDGKGTLSNITVGYMRSSIAGEKYNGADISASFLYKLNLQNSFAGFGVGLGFDESGIDTNSTINTLGAELKVGYTLYDTFDIPLSFRLGVGTTYITDTKTTKDWHWQAQYSFDANYIFYNALGAGIKYKYNKIHDKPIHNTIFFLSVSF